MGSRRQWWSGAVVVVLFMVAGCASATETNTSTAGDGTAATQTDGTAAGPTGDADNPATPVASPGCGSSAAEPSQLTESFLTVDGTERRYLLTVPDAHDGETPLPVVFDFHGLMEGADVHAEMTQYSALATEEGFVAVFPHGTGQPVAWNANPAADPNLDLVYFDALRDELGGTLCLDESRIYATGLSNGAMFTSLLLCQRADVLAAAAPVAGLTDSADCEPSRAVPIVAFHGTEDPILLFNGGVDLTRLPGAEGGEDGAGRPEADLDGAGYPAAVAAFADRNGCDPDPTDTELTPEVIHRVYDCPAGADVEFYIIVGGGHSWPSSEFSKTIGDIVGPTTDDIDATRDAWQFMRQFTNP